MTFLHILHCNNEVTHFYKWHLKSIFKLRQKCRKKPFFYIIIIIVVAVFLVIMYIILVISRDGIISKLH